MTFVPVFFLKLMSILLIVFSLSFFPALTFADPGKQALSKHEAKSWPANVTTPKKHGYNFPLNYPRSPQTSWHRDSDCDDDHYESIRIPPYQFYDQRSLLSQARELISATRHVRRAVSSPSYFGNENRKLIKAIDHFAGRSDGLYRHILQSRSSRVDIDRRIRHLIDDSRDVGKQLTRADVNPHVDADWQKVVKILFDLNAAQGGGYFRPRPVTIPAHPIDWRRQSIFGSSSN